MPTTYPGEVQFPAALDTAVSLVEGAHDASANLSGGVTSADAIIPLVDASRLPASGFALIDDELVSYAERTTVALGTAENPARRAQGGTTAAAHLGGAAADNVITARALAAHTRKPSWRSRRSSASGLRSRTPPPARRARTCKPRAGALPRGRPSRART